ncbi:MAG: hypothetical protein HRT98_03495 [Mycoplasmatales bacterium]|nr:hypothetical protein [Mycoplasmatales bacterium]
MPIYKEMNNKKRMIKIKNKRLLLLGLTSIATLTTVFSVSNVTKVEDKTINSMHASYSHSINSIYQDQKVIQAVDYKKDTSTKKTIQKNQHQSNPNKKQNAKWAIPVLITIVLLSVSCLGWLLFTTSNSKNKPKKREKKIKGQKIK